jgi:N-acetylmuramic acid 6-phosphate etherase
MTLPPTEQRNPASMELDQLSSLALVTLMNQEDAHVLHAVHVALPQIAQAVDTIVAALERDGRWFVMGAGTSGRLALLDAVELLPTFGLAPDVVIPLLAGGQGAFVRAVENAEDRPELGEADLTHHNLTAADVVLGVAASGRTPYVLGGLAYARTIGAPTIAMTCNPHSAMAAAADLAIEVVTGPEVLTGSTRLKAGTAQKLVLNMLSTATMVKLGKTYSNLMVDVQPTNAKLRQRAARIVAEIADITHDEARALLEQAGWEVKTAVVMGLAHIDAAKARRRLHAQRGRVRAAVGDGVSG